ncbi:MAG: chlororespiratory reduction protein 7 [Cyanobacteriota bacterium]|nr:chlororespiratory reduction protein 7 [Cyanobacteriota bacterium]
MSDPLLREMDHYVVLEPGGEEVILTAAETRTWLARHLSALASSPADLAHLPDLPTQVERLLDTACELEVAPGLAIQWFAVRLEPPQSP